MPRSPESVRSLLHSSRSLRRLGQQVDEQRWLLDQLQQVLPEPLAGHCKAAVWSDERLTLYTDSAAWASRLRYLAPEVRRWLAPRIPSISRVQVRILIGEHARNGDRQTQPRAAKRMSSDSRRLLMQVAAGFGDDELSRALRRLARHGE